MDPYGSGPGSEALGYYHFASFHRSTVFKFLILLFSCVQGEPQKCECGNYFKLIDYDPLDPNIRPKYGMGFGSGLGSIYY